MFNATNISIYKTNDGIWVAQVPIGKYSNGNIKYKRFKNKKKSVVKEKMDAYIRGAEYASINTVEDLRVADYLEWYMHNVKKKILQPASFDREYRTAKYHIIPYIGQYTLSDINTSILQHELIDKLAIMGYSNSSIHKAQVLIKAMLKYAAEHNVIPSATIGKILVPKQPFGRNNDVRFLSENELTMFKNQAYSQRKNGSLKYKYGPMLVFMVYTGLRPGELCALKWDCVNFDNKTLKIMSTATTNYSSGSRDTTVKQGTKRISSNRIIPLNKTALDILMSLYSDGTPEDYFILTNSTTICPADVLSNSYKSIATAAGIKNPKGAHTLRHTFASLLFAKGVDVKIISELLGHRSVNITYNIYVHVAKEHRAKSIELLDL